MMKQVNAVLDQIKTAYLQQGQWGRILVPGLFLIVLCCLCSITLSLFRPRSASTPLPSPFQFPTEGTPVTPTGLFDFLTFTPFPTSTSFVPTPFPTLTVSPTGIATASPTPSPTVTMTHTPPATSTPVPTNTVTATPTNVPPIQIVNVDKVAEYVEIQNLTQLPINLRGWRLVSEAGNESCDLRGTLDPNQVLRVWSRRGNPGFDCRLGRDIWIDTASDPAVIYNPQGQEVSRYP